MWRLATAGGRWEETRAVEADPEPTRAMATVESELLRSGPRAAVDQPTH